MVIVDLQAVELQASLSPDDGQCGLTLNLLSLVDRSPWWGGQTLERRGGAAVWMSVDGMLASGTSPHAVTVSL